MMLQCSLIGVCWILSLLPDVLGASYLHSLPTYDGCAWADSELSVTVLEAEPVLLHCWDFDRLILGYDLTAANGYTFHIARGNHDSPVALGDEGRVRPEKRSLWLLPSQPSDSGTYTCVVSVHPAGKADMEMMSYLVDPVMPGNDVIIPCPTDPYNITGTPHWYKAVFYELVLFQGQSGAVLPVGRGRYLPRWGGSLLIKRFSAADSGFYTCSATVRVFSALYIVTRTSRVHSTGQAAPTFQPATLSASTHTPEIVDGYAHILSPTNNSVIKSHFGSSLVIRCTVATGSQLADSTLVTWLIDGQSVEESSLALRAFQKGRRVTDGQVEADLVILEVRAEDSGVEFRCVTQNSAGSEEVLVHIEMEGEYCVCSTYPGVTRSEYLSRCYTLRVPIQVLHAQSTYPGVTRSEYLSRCYTLRVPIQVSHAQNEWWVWLVVCVSCSCCFVCVVCVFLYQLLRPRKLKQNDYFLARQDSVF
ncbi:interleukin-1 receptor type 2 [Clupea harengus]|uniref:Interleukin-1 receptor type 2 n=1 Tax=Clupea harengus TaxID=7950 RepID=A0A8M1K5N1_CLUHA|nr:interleukin-1 receptor type 2 [Clupea harengus]